MKIFIASIKPYSRYRSGQPWAGVLVRKEEFHAAESRYSVDMHAGLFEGSAEQGGRLYVEAEPGDVVAWGQQGIRYNDTGERHGRVKGDGSVETLPDKAAAYRLLDEMAAEARLAADRPETPVQPVVPETAFLESTPQAEQEDPVQPVVPEEQSSAAEPATGSEDSPNEEPDEPVQRVVPEELAPEAEPPAAMEGGSEEPVQPAVPEETAPEPEPQAASENQHAEPEYESVVNPFGHD